MIRSKSVWEEREFENHLKVKFEKTTINRMWWTNLSISDPMSMAMSLSSPNRSLKSESASSCFPFSNCFKTFSLVAELNINNKYNIKQGKEENPK